MPESAQCLICAPYRIGQGACEAFPDRIPKAIMTGEFDHSMPFPGDRGLRFIEYTEKAAQVGRTGDLP